MPARRIKLSIRLKIAFTFTFLVVAIMGVVTYIYTIRDLNLQKQQMDLRMERLAGNIATIRSVNTEDWQVYQNYINHQLLLNPEIVYIGIFDEGQQLRAFALNTHWLELDRPESLSPRQQEDIVWRLHQRQIDSQSQADLASKSVNIIIGGQFSGHVNVGFSLIELNDALKTSLVKNFLISLLFVVIAVVFAFYISHRIVKPLNLLTNAMRQISLGKLDQTLNIQSGDEIGEMADTFNFMAQGLSAKAKIQAFSQRLGLTANLDEIIEVMLQQTLQGLGSSKGCFFLGDREQVGLFKLAGCYPSMKHDGDLECCPEVHALLEKDKSPIPMSQTARLSPAFEKLSARLGFHPGGLIAPIFHQENLIALLLIDAPEKGNSFSKDALSFLDTMLVQGGLAIENMLLLEDLTEQERMKRELEIARDVQTRLLPQNPPLFRGLEMDGYCIPSTEVGGDYFDYFVIDADRIGIAIADVAGKGTQAAFYMAVLKGLMLCLSKQCTSPKELLSEVNNRLWDRMDRKVFITMIYAVLDMKARTCTFARAGHNGLVLKSAATGEVKTLAPSGIGLGLENGKIFDKTIKNETVDIRPEDQLFFYTDGLFEAMDGQAPFGEERLLAVIRETDRPSAKEMRMTMINAIREFTGDTPQHDDMTMVTVRVTTL